MGEVMRLWSLFQRHEPTRLDALRQLSVLDANDGLPRCTRVLYAGAEDFPTKEQAADRLAAAEVLNEIAWREQERAKEREFHASRVVSITVRAVRS